MFSPLENSTMMFLILLILLLKSLDVESRTAEIFVATQTCFLCTALELSMHENFSIRRISLNQNSCLVNCFHVKFLSPYVEMSTIIIFHQ
jgi:hypothetical protein